MTDDGRILRTGQSAGDGTGQEPGTVQNRMMWNLKRIKFTVSILAAFTASFSLISVITHLTGTNWKHAPLPFSSSRNRPTPAIPPMENNRPDLFLNPSKDKEGSLLVRPREPWEEDFLDSQSFKSFVNKKGGNFSSVAEYLLSVTNYLRTFRSPMIREDPSQYSWPETESEKTQRQSISSTKHIVYYNPPFYVTGKGKEPFQRCPVKDCVFSRDYKKDHNKADAVVFLGGPGKPVFPRSHPGQIYIFMTMESPWHTGRRYGNTAWNMAFNWTWNFRVDSDIFEPVGYLKRNSLVPSHSSLLNMTRQKKNHVAWMASHCNVQSRRDEYVRKLRKVIPVDIYGSCGNLHCRRNDPKCDTILNDYFFYLSFENSMCVDYITEKYYKTFFDGLNVLPVVRGGANYSRFFPSGTFIDAESFSGPEDLGRYLLALAKDEAAYVDMLWRKAHFLYHEHGIIDTFCQMCYKVHHVDRFKRTYKDMYGWYHKDGCSDPKPF